MPTRKITPYNRFVKSFSKTYKGSHKGGAMMKAAGRAWRSKGKGKKTTKRRSASSKVSNVGKGNSKMFRTLGAKGALEDFAWGFSGIVLMGAGNPVALPAIRLVQGVQGHVFGRTGKGRLVYAIIDLADLVIAGQASVQGIFDSMRQLTKVIPA